MRIYNRDGTEGRMAGNCIRCVAKFLYDSGRVTAEEMTIETASGVKRLRVYTRDGRVTSADVDMGRAVLDAAAVPCTLPYARAIGVPAVIGGREYTVTCVSMGNPHCVVFTDSVDALDLDTLGPQFENAPVFPERVNAEFVRVVNRTTLRMRCYERGNGETMACGTGACAAVVAAVENGLCEKDTDVNAVSYTHLDVYKRQGWGSRRASIWASAPRLPTSPPPCSKRSAAASAWTARHFIRRLRWMRTCLLYTSRCV